MVVINYTTNNNMEINKNMNRIIGLFFLLIVCSWSSIQGQMISGPETSSSSLQALNLINVTIGGDFPVGGTYLASRTERVDQLITRVLVEYRAELLRTTPDEQLLSLMKNQMDDFAKRNILLKRFSGEELIVDLVKFRLTGDFSYNPYLNNDDVLIFPPLDFKRNFIHITGAVKKETKFEFVNGEKLSDAILIAHGINPAYEGVTKASISRLSNDGMNETELVVKIEDNPILKRGDRIRILSDENEKQDYSVLVLGEVKNPGRVFITKNATTINEVIEKVGGFTENASLKFSEVIRGLDSYSMLRKQMLEKNAFGNNSLFNFKKFLTNLKQLDYLRMYRTADLTIRDTLFFGIDNQLRALDGFTQLDFRNLIDENSNESKFKLADQDVIIIPKKSEDVYVWGGVKQVGNYHYDKNMTIRDYIEKAGGLTEIAYGDDEIYLIKGKSRDWINIDFDSDYNIEAGDYIYVKKEVPQDTEFYITRIAAYAGIIGSIATVILLLNQLNK